MTIEITASTFSGDNLKQNEFVKAYSAYLNTVLQNDQVRTFLESEAGISQASSLTFSWDQNANSLPKFFIDGAALSQEQVDVFATLFVVESVTVVTGKTVQTRYAAEVNTDTLDAFFNPANPYGENPLFLDSAEGADGLAGADSTQVAANGANGTTANNSDQLAPIKRAGKEGADATIPGGNGEDGGAAIEVDQDEAFSSLVVDASQTSVEITGGNGGDGGDGANGGKGGNGVQSGVGGAGGDGSSGGNGGDGSVAVVNGDVSDVYIIGSEDVTILGGNGGEGGTGGAGGAGGTGTTSGAAGKNGTDGQDGTSAAAFSDRVDVDASKHEGFLTISGSNEDDTFVIGSGGSLVFDTLGDDTYTFGKGEDTLVFGELAGGNNTVYNFDVDQDQLDFQGQAYTTSDEDGSAIFQVGETTSVTIVGVAATDVSVVQYEASNFA